ncbi:M14 family metallopeptidase [Halodesulfovibrio marinisediminis]|uniref:Carboxypeptidase controlling helical cell shape n=1 Tax=Halodesulfovibrio marinisediminis DSM 17456 TaxID=1121457 RepID=A0A1N6EYZ0_9BACT|nr:M14 family metallopeptidase [Halodesulfovibrio marinisediminis]SIN88214.1 Carboxypeptidase controlling helical cell shape [Halodesulfovibrio marinisediminis DSM 17456]
MRLLLSFILITLTAISAFAQNPLDFSLHKLGNDPNGPTILVVGGIQGDEPGGFSAAGMLVSHYEITKGNVWVVPNLNFLSIIKSSRGSYGDMNRKFAALDKNDPDYRSVQRIKEIIRNEQVDLVLNLHDGSGFYNPKYLDKLHNPRFWGQCVIIDQKDIEHPLFGNLEVMAESAVKKVNAGLLKKSDKFHLKNTRTREGDHEMEKSLTYFAVRHGKPAFGIEASKSFRTPTRTYYHLSVLESFLKQAGIEFSRDFDMNPRSIKQAMFSQVTLALYGGKLQLDLDNVRKYLNYVPMNKSLASKFEASKPLLTMVDAPNGYKIYYGNRNLTNLLPQFFEFDDSLSSLQVVVDGRSQEVPMGTIIDVDSHFSVNSLKGYRVNIIGYVAPNKGAESDVLVRKEDLTTRFSLDKSGRIYRVETYRGDKFSGMVLVRFTNNNAVASR